MDEKGEPVNGAVVGTFAMGQSNREPLWSFSDPSSKSDKQGVATLPTGRFRGDSIVLYALHTEHQLAAFKEVPREVLGGSVEIKLKPACHVHGSLTSSELGTLGRKIDSDQCISVSQWEAAFIIQFQEPGLRIHITAWRISAHRLRS